MQKSCSESPFTSARKFLEDSVRPTAHGWDPPPPYLLPLTVYPNHFHEVRLFPEVDSDRFFRITATNIGSEIFADRCFQKLDWQRKRCLTGQRRLYLRFIVESRPLDRIVPRGDQTVFDGKVFEL